MLIDLFNKARSQADPDLANWAYQGDSFNEYNGAEDILKWWDWCSEQPRPDYLPKDEMKRLIDISRKFDESFVKAHNLTYNFSKYEVGRMNAQDYWFNNLVLHKESDTLNILDFGAGYGRQINLYSQLHDFIYVGMDAIPRSYCLQHLYFKHTKLALFEYIEQSFKIKEKGIYHIPTWEYNVLPDNFFDKILCVQVLQELDEGLVRKIIPEFHRVLKSTGTLYIRDSEWWKPVHDINMTKLLEDSGFILEYRPHVVDKDLHGIPRFWRKINPKVVSN